MIIWIFRILFLVLLIASVAVPIVLWLNKNDKYNEEIRTWSRSNSSDQKPEFPSMKKYILGGVAAFLFSLLGLGVWGSAKYIPATSVGVVENTTTGSFSTIGPGIHVWPLQSNLVPFASKVTEYSLKRQRIEIGIDPETENAPVGIAAGSNSPGNPAVYIQARGWATPNQDNVIILHRRYGGDYQNVWVERNWVTAVKSVQGQYPYDYLIKSRQKFADEVEQTLQAQMYEGDEQLVEVSQLAVTNFEFDGRIQEQLQQTAQKQFETQRAREEVEIAKQQQEKAKVEAETRLQVAEKDAESKVAAARGEAEAVRLVNEAIAQQGTAYLTLKWIERWDGILPKIQTGEGTGTLLQLPDNIAG